VVRFSPIPVLTIHKEWSALKIDEIVVPVDFSPHSMTAVNKAKQIATKFNAQLEFVHVVEEDVHPEFYNISFEPILKANPALKDHILKNLQKLSGLKKEQAKFVVLEGKVSEEIKEYAENHGADMVVLPTRGMSDLEHLFLGSNTEKIVRIAPCPVLTVRS
jgi:nucleotide-binding universal stress UspA family protein